MEPQWQFLAPMCLDTQDGMVFAEIVGGSGFGFDIPAGLYELAATRWQSRPDPDAGPATVTSPARASCGIHLASGPFPDGTA